MTTYEFVVSCELPVEPTLVYRAWLSSEEHSAMTGAAADVDPVVGGAFTAWDGYITGRTLELEPDRHIAQSWRTTEFTSEQADSRIDVRLDATAAGTLVTLAHSGVPADQLGYEQGGWEDSYFEPMRAYFAR
jgi:activator of HSP90 ATPase